jgi:hypothetical protein
VLEREFGVREVQVSTARRKDYERPASKSASEAHNEWSQLHADYYESAGYVFSAVLFLGEEEGDVEPRAGGETGLADALAHDDGGGVTLVGGLVVEPRRGRLVIFSGGGENYHAPLPVTRGRRTTFHAWFKCNCTPARLSESEFEAGGVATSMGPTHDANQALGRHPDLRAAPAGVPDKSEL